MWQRTKHLALLVALALGLPGNASAGVNIPDWLRQVAAQPIGSYPPETKAVVLLDRTEYTVLGAGEYIQHSRNVVKILRPTGHDSKELGVDLEGKDKLQSVHAWTIDKAGREYEVKEKEFTEEGDYPGWILYADDRAMMAKAPASLPGSVIALEYEVRRHRWINELGWIYQDQNPVLQGVMTVQLPAGWEYRAAWTNGSSVDPTQLGTNRWQWTLNNVPGIEEEKEVMMPPFLSLVGHMSLSYFAPGEKSKNAASWKEVGLWYTDLTKDRFKSSPEISAKVAELVRGRGDFISKLQALTLFMQSEIRYVAISIGIGGDQPHIASDVFRFRFGDCKDKVTLLKAMLQEAGIHSHYVLVDTHRGFMNPAVPSSWGNHAIIAIEIPDDLKEEPYQSTVKTSSGRRYTIFDPTDEYTPVGSLRSELQNTYGLLVADEGGELVRTPLLPPDWNQLIRSGHFVLSEDGSLAGEVSEDRSSDSAARERERLHYNDQRERTSEFERWLGRSIQGFTLENVNVEHADQLTNDLILNYKFTAPQYAQARGSLMLVRPRVLDEKGAHVEHKPRHYPIELRHTTRQTDTYEIELPKEYQIEDLPQATQIDVGFASYQSKIEAEGNKLRYWREYLIRDLSIPPEKFDDWVKLQAAIGADETAAVILKRVQ